MKRKCCGPVLQRCSNVLLLGRTDLDECFPQKQNQWSRVEALQAFATCAIATIPRKIGRSF